MATNTRGRGTSLTECCVWRVKISFLHRFQFLDQIVFDAVFAHRSTLAHYIQFKLTGTLPDMTHYNGARPCGADDSPHLFPDGRSSVCCYGLQMAWHQAGKLILTEPPVSTSTSTRIRAKERGSCFAFASVVDTPKLCAYVPQAA